MSVAAPILLTAFAEKTNTTPVGAARSFAAGAQAAIATVDLSMVRLKLMDADEGEGWSAELADRIIPEYRKFLLLTKTYPELGIVPAKLVDKVWHHHILDTRAYAVDCETVFGHFMHHFPYWGMRGDSDLADLNAAYAATLQLYEAHFGEPDYDIWAAPGRCPNCGRR